MHICMCVCVCKYIYTHTHIYIYSFIIMYWFGDNKCASDSLISNDWLLIKYYFFGIANINYVLGVRHCAISETMMKKIVHLEVCVK